MVGALQQVCSDVREEPFDLIDRIQMTDSRQNPHGPSKLPDEQPVLNPTDLSNQAALRTGASSRWLVPSAVLAAVAIVLYCFAFQLQIVLPIVGIIFVTLMWIAMFIAARRGGPDAPTNRRLAWLMVTMAVGAFLVAVGIYIVESTRLPWT